MRPWNLLPLAMLVAACSGDETPNPGGTGGTAGGGQDAGGSGGSTDADGSGGSQSDADAMSGTRCDNGIGAGGDGCAENWSVLGEEIGFSVSPHHLTTRAGPSGPMQVRGISFYTIPDAVLKTLQDGTTLRTLVDDSVVPAATTWTNDLTWEGHRATLTLTPSSPLADGWYAVDVVGSLDTGHNSLIWIPAVGQDHYQAAFRVGSAPVLVSVGACGGVVSLAFSEEVVVPEPPPITVISIGLNLTKTCTRDTSAGPADAPARSASLLCPDLNDIDGTRVLLEEGIATAEQIPLKTAAGATTAEIVLDKDLGTNTCRTWEETVIPVF